MPSARAGITALAAVAVCAILGLVVVALTDDRDLAFTLGVQPSQPAVVVAPGERACQRPIDTSAAARTVKFKPSTSGRPGPPLAVEVRTAAGERAVGVVRGGYPDLAWQSAQLDREVRDDRRIEVCISNRGDRRVALLGGPALAARTSAAHLGRRALPTDIALVFERGDSSSMLSLVPTAFERATLFHFSWLGPWSFWALGILVMLVVPLLLIAALKAAAAVRRAEPPSL